MLWVLILENYKVGLWRCSGIQWHTVYTSIFLWKPVDCFKIGYVHTLARARVVIIWEAHFFFFRKASSLITIHLVLFRVKYDRRFRRPECATASPWKWFSVIRRNICPLSSKVRNDGRWILDDAVKTFFRRVGNTLLATQSYPKDRISPFYPTVNTPFALRTNIFPLSYSHSYVFTCVLFTRNVWPTFRVTSV